MQLSRCFHVSLHSAYSAFSHLYGVFWRVHCPSVRSDACGRRHDWERTGRFAVWGTFIMGPILHHWYKGLERIFPGQTLAQTVWSTASSLLIASFARCSRQRRSCWSKARLQWASFRCSWARWAPWRARPGPRRRSGSGRSGGPRCSPTGRFGAPSLYDLYVVSSLFCSQSGSICSWLGFNHSYAPTIQACHSRIDFSIGLACRKLSQLSVWYVLCDVMPAY